MRQVLQDTGGIIKPAFILSDTQDIGIPSYGNFYTVGGAFTGQARTDAGTPTNFGFINLGATSGTLLNGSGSMNVGIWSLQHATGQAQGMLNFMTATGDRWDSVSGVGAGTQLGEISFNGSSTHGMIQTECASIWCYADEDFTDTGYPVTEQNTHCGANLVIRVTQNGTGSERITALFDQSGGLAIGNWQAHGNSFPAGNFIFFKDAANAPSYSVTGGGIMMSYAGKPMWRASGATGAQPMVMQTGSCASGHVAKFNAFGVIEDAGFAASSVVHSDFVFDPGYALLPLQEVEQHISERGRLPGVPTGEIDLMGRTELLMQKVEELTLYVLQLHKRLAVAEGNTK